MVFTIIAYYDTWDFQEEKKRENSGKNEVGAYTCDYETFLATSLIKLNSVSLKVYYALFMDGNFNSGYS